MNYVYKSFWNFLKNSVPHPWRRWLRCLWSLSACLVSAGCLIMCTLCTFTMIKVHQGDLISNMCTWLFTGWPWQILVSILLFITPWTRGKFHNSIHLFVSFFSFIIETYDHVMFTQTRNVYFLKKKTSNGLI